MLPSINKLAMREKLVLVFEDNDDIREIVSIILLDAGYRIERCSIVKNFVRLSPISCLVYGDEHHFAGWQWHLNL